MSFGVQGRFSAARSGWRLFERPPQSLRLGFRAKQRTRIVMNSKLKTLLAAAGLVVALAGAAGTASATPWQTHHPRRVEVNHRLANQNHRIFIARKAGLINGGKAFRLHMADHRIRMQERWFARHDHGQITRAEQARLNHEENRVSHRI
jgi:hypothetical protein